MSITRRWLSTARSIVPDLEVDNIVIGGGVVGLALGEKLTRSRPKESTFVVEKNKRVGEETSSRNSEVIHAGIYYPPNSLKTKLCIQGNRMLYSVLEKNRLAFRKIGKWIVAQDKAQTEYLKTLEQKAQRLGVPVFFLDRKEAQCEEPLIKAEAILVSPSTGILDSHAYMDYLEQQTEVALATQVTAIRPQPGGYLLQLVTGQNPPSWIGARRVFNSAGLHAPKIAAMVLGQASIPPHHFARGHYYRTSGPPIHVRRLIYPCPEKNLAGLGTHLTLDLAGQVKFGPDVEYIDKLDYSLQDLSDEKKAQFAKAIQSYLPSLDSQKLYLDYSGIR
ncbi:FAD dependent oxidoreductase [Sporodiniella umbellata]|nr:FAD dependent oxidoreductase [Sporodiniella umbellata]